MEPLRNSERLAGMPSGAVEHQHNLLLFARSNCLSEVLQCQRKDFGVHGRQEQPLGVSRCWMDKRIDVEPLIAMLHYHRRTLPVEDPDPTDDWLESDAMLIESPQFDCRLRSGLLHLIDGFGQFF